jgi:hypothetical protein
VGRDIDVEGGSAEVLLSAPNLQRSRTACFQLTARAFPRLPAPVALTRLLGLEEQRPIVVVGRIRGGP